MVGSAGAAIKAEPLSARQVPGSRARKKAPRLASGAEFPRLEWQGCHRIEREVRDPYLRRG